MRERLALAMSLMQRALVLSIVLGGFAARGAQAQQTAGAVQLTFDAPAGCPDRDDVLHAIEGLVAGETELDRSLQVEAQVRARAAGDYALSVSWRGEQGAGHREIEAESCVAAADAAAWLIALALRSPRPAEDAQTPSEARFSFELGARAVADTASLPGTAFGGGVQAGFAWSRLHVSLSVDYFPAKSAQVAGVSGEIDLAELGVSACYLFASPTLELGPCLRASIGRMSAYSPALETQNERSARVQSFAASMQLRVHLVDVLWLATEAALSWNQRRPVFMISGRGMLHQPDEIGLWLGLGALIALE